METIRTRSIPMTDMSGQIPVSRSIHRALGIVTKALAADAADDRGRTVRDTLLTCPTPEEMAAYVASMPRTDLGKVWDGIIRPVLEGLQPDQKQKVFDSFDAYRRGKSTATGDTKDSFLGRTRDEARNLIRSVNEANRAFWDKRKKA